MSLTQEQKKIALECLEESADHYDSVATIKAKMIWERGINNFLSRIREGQEAVGIVRMTKTHDPRPVPKWIGTSLHIVMDLKDGDKLFTTPPAAPCDCSELVEAINKVLSMQPYMATKVMEVCDILTEALANHAKRMKGEES